MHFVDTNYEENFYSSDIFDFYFGEARLGVFDIETTGLSAGSAQIVLGGIIIPDVKGMKLRQFFSDGGHEEAELLDLYADKISDVDVLFSYNGDRFDIPFVNGRLARHHRPPAFDEILSVDMYRVVRAHSELRGMLPNLKQKTVEDYMGLWRSRKDQISGADSVYLYYEYLATKSPKLLDYILLHNSDDLLQLARILGIFEQLDLHKIVSHIGFPVRNGETTAFVDKILLKRESLEFYGHYRILPFDYVLFDEIYSANFDNETRRFGVTLPCLCEKDLTFADLEAIKIEDASLQNSPHCKSSYLILRQNKAINYGAVNHLIKLMLKQILGRFTA
jgi:uncharacterized protein YprB with RNaseH-like and TPR domain